MKGSFPAVKLSDGVHWVGAIDWDRRLFDSLIPLPDGTSYNSYLVTGEKKVALIDAVDPAMLDVLMARLEDVPRLDYLVSQHVEQDHSGAIPAVLEKYPQAKLLCSAKAKGMLESHLHIAADRIRVVEDGEEVALGGKTLKFIYTPWVHWPETMVTYLKENKLLFSCDFFGSHIATSELCCQDRCRVYEAAKRYFAEIMMPFRHVIKDNLKKLEAYEIGVIAPSHGQVHQDPSFIIEAYREWVLAESKNLVALPYVSMHGSTRKMVDYLVDALSRRGVAVEQFSLPETDIGKLAMSLVDARTIVLGTPTVLAGPHPLAAYAAFLANALRPEVKFLSIIGSYGWGGKTVDVLAAMIPNLKVELIDPVLCTGMPGAAEFKALDALAAAIKKKHESVKQ